MSFSIPLNSRCNTKATFPVGLQLFLSKRKTYVDVNIRVNQQSHFE